MPNDNEQNTGGVQPETVARPTGRRRMAGYLSHTQSEPAAQNAEGPSVTLPSDAVAGIQDAASQHAAPARKTRMGQRAPEPKSQPRMGENSSPAPATPVARTRMGEAGASTSNGRTRMGSGAAKAPEPAIQPTAAASPSTSTSDGTRMAAPRSSAPAVEQPATAPNGRDTLASTASRPVWLRPTIIIGVLVIVALAVVFGARGLRTLEPIREFIATYDGHASQPASAPAGMPGWMGWQHFFNMFFLVLIVRTGLQVRNERKPPAHWTANKNSFFSPPGATPKKVSLTQWLHQSLDVLWVLNGLVFVVLLIVSEHWMRIVPTSWDIFPNMLSGAIQYASLDWPTEDGWVHYNALQVMAYFVTVFIAAPLAVISGIRISTWWPDKNDRLNKIYPVEVARVIHFPVMLYFVFFTITHVFLVFFTGALRNLNHMYTSRDVVDWWGLLIFIGSLVVIAAVWFLTKPLFTRPIAGRMGSVSK